MTQLHEVTALPQIKNPGRSAEDKVPRKVRFDYTEPTPLLLSRNTRRDHKQKTHHNI